jgi:hypothetical protein
VRSYNEGVQEKLTRRDLTAALAWPVARVTAQPPAQSDALDRARKDIRADIELLKKFTLPPATEPATVFRP